MNKQAFKITAFVVVIALIVGFVVYWSVDKRMPSITDSWVTYQSDKGFSFKYPAGYTATESISPENENTTIVFVAAANEKGEPRDDRPPVLQMNITDYSVSFSLWEGMVWEGYPEIVKTFSFE